MSHCSTFNLQLSQAASEYQIVRDNLTSYMESGKTALAPKIGTGLSHLEGLVQDYFRDYEEKVKEILYQWFLGLEKHQNEGVGMFEKILHVNEQNGRCEIKGEIKLQGSETIPAVIGFIDTLNIKDCSQEVSLFHLEKINNLNIQNELGVNLKGAHLLEVGRIEMKGRGSMYFPALTKVIRIGGENVTQFYAPELTEAKEILNNEEMYGSIYLPSIEEADFPKFAFGGLHFRRAETVKAPKLINGDVTAPAARVVDLGSLTRSINIDLSSMEVIDLPNLIGARESDTVNVIKANNAKRIRIPLLQKLHELHANNAVEVHSPLLTSIRQLHRDSLSAEDLIKLFPALREGTLHSNAQTIERLKNNPDIPNTLKVKEFVDRRAAEAATAASRARRAPFRTS